MSSCVAGRAHCVESRAHEPRHSGGVRRLPNTRITYTLRSIERKSCLLHVTGKAHEQIHIDMGEKAKLRLERHFKQELVTDTQNGSTVFERRSVKFEYDLTTKSQCHRTTPCWSGLRKPYLKPQDSANTVLESAASTAMYTSHQQKCPTTCARRFKALAVT